MILRGERGRGRDRGVRRGDVVRRQPRDGGAGGHDHRQHRPVRRGGGENEFGTVDVSTTNDTDQEQSIPVLLQMQCKDDESRAYPERRPTGVTVSVPESP